MIKRRSQEDQIISWETLVHHLIKEAKKLGFDVEQRKYARLLLIQKLHDFGVNVSAEVAAQYANEMLRPMAQRRRTLCCRASGGDPGACQVHECVQRRPEIA